MLSVKLHTVSRKFTLKHVSRDVTFKHVGSRGLSAYQVAVLNGFVGTEAEWLASLQGIPGDPTEGLPFGGTTGQVLTKLSNEDYDTGWRKPSISLFDIYGVEWLIGVSSSGQLTTTAIANVEGKYGQSAYGVATYASN